MQFFTHALGICTTLEKDRTTQQNGRWGGGRGHLQTFKYGKGSTTMNSNDELRAFVIEKFRQASMKKYILNLPHGHGERVHS